MKAYFQILIPISLLCSCSVGLSPGGSRVIETNDQTVVQCDFIGLIKDHAPMGGFSNESIKNDFRSKASSMGATHIVYQTTVSGMIEGGKAYRCIEPVMNEVSSYGQQISPPPPTFRNEPTLPPPPIDNGYGSGYKRY